MVGRMLGVFESSGKLKEGLGHLLKFYESELQLRNEQIKLIHYPIILGLFFSGAGLRSTDFCDSNVHKPLPSSWTRTFLTYKDAGEAQ